MDSRMGIYACNRDVAGPGELSEWVDHSKRWNAIQDSSLDRFQPGGSSCPLGCWRCA
jgi:hypothetical protein